MIISNSAYNKVFLASRQSGFLLYEALVSFSLLAAAAYALAQLAQQGYGQYQKCHAHIAACRVVQSVTAQIRAGALDCTSQTGRHDTYEYKVIVGKRYPGLALVPVKVTVGAVGVETMVLCA